MIYDHAGIMDGMSSFFTGTAEGDPLLRTGEGKTILIILHTFAAGGSQAAVLELVPLLQKLSYDIYAIAPADGVYKKKFTDAGVSCATAERIENNAGSREFFANAFDLVFVNSICSCFFIYYFLNTRIPVLWWVHEVETTLAETTAFFPYPPGMSDNIHFLGVTKDVNRAIKKIYAKEADELPFPVRDQRKEPYRVPDGKVRFFLPASYEPRKGQDVLLNAVAKLPEEYRKRSEFILCGFVNQSEDGLMEQYADLIRETGEMFDNVRVMGELSRDETFELFQTCHCLLAPSRLDCTPMTAVEGMMFEKIVLVSSGAGISDYLQDCISGFVFQNGDVDDLYKRLLLIIEDAGKMGGIAAAGRKVYEECFSPDIVSRMLEKNILRVCV